MSAVRTPVTETTERFLRGILTQVPLDRIEELHLFLPLRQGLVETGIAVIAARVILPAPEDSAPLELPLALNPGSAATEPEANASAVPSGAESEANDSATATASDTEDIDKADIDTDDIDTDDSSPYAPDAAVDTARNLGDQAAVPDRVVRHTVYTARYRLVIKGPERGRWELDVVDEADAPLLTIETVVRGVQQRAGEATATVRYDARQLAAVLRLPEPVSP